MSQARGRGLRRAGLWRGGSSVGVVWRGGACRGGGGGGEGLSGGGALWWGGAWRGGASVGGGLEAQTLQSPLAPGPAPTPWALAGGDPWLPAHHADPAVSGLVWR